MVESISNFYHPKTIILLKTVLKPNCSINSSKKIPKQHDFLFYKKYFI